MINWGELLSERAKRGASSPPIKYGRDLSLSNMFRELNARLDDWSRTWVWTGTSLEPASELTSQDHPTHCISVRLRALQGSSPSTCVCV